MRWVDFVVIERIEIEIERSNIEFLLDVGSEFLQLVTHTSTTN